MPDLDMIPRSYRERVWTRRQLTRYGAALALLVALMLAGAGVLRWRVAAIDAELLRLRSDTAHAQAATLLADTAGARATLLEQSVAVLVALRGAGDMERVADAFDAVMPRGVWLRQMRLARDAQPLVAPTPPLPDDLQAPATAGVAAQSWRVATTVQLHGQAADYATLAGFLRALGQQPAFSQVNLTASSASPGADTIDFDAVATVRRAGGATP